MAKPAKKKAKADDKNREVKGCFIATETLADLARYVCGVDHGVTPLFSVRNGSSYRLFALGAKLKGVRLLYHYDVPKGSGFLVYNTWGDGDETAEIRDRPSEGQDFKAFKVPIMEIAENAYSDVKPTAKDFQNVKKIELRDYGSMVKAMLAMADHYNVMPELYSFPLKGERVIGCFDLINESGMKSFAYARTGKRESFNYIQYEYNTDTMATSNSIGEKRHGVARVINIKGLPFF